MTPLGLPILGVAAVIASPALYAGLVEGTMPIDVALTRYLVAVGLCWALFSLLVEWVLPSSESVALAIAERERTAREAAQKAPTGGTPGGPGSPGAPGS